MWLGELVAVHILRWSHCSWWQSNFEPALPCEQGAPSCWTVINVCLVASRPNTIILMVLNRSVQINFFISKKTLFVNFTGRRRISFFTAFMTFLLDDSDVIWAGTHVKADSWRSRFIIRWKNDCSVLLRSFWCSACPWLVFLQTNTLLTCSVIFISGIQTDLYWPPRGILVTADPVSSICLQISSMMSWMTDQLPVLFWAFCRHSVISQSIFMQRLDSHFISHRNFSRESGPLIN